MAKLKCCTGNEPAGTLMYVFNAKSDHYLQIMVLPFDLIMVLWEDTIPSGKIMTWVPSDYVVHPPRWSDLELKSKMLEWSARNQTLIEVGVDEQFKNFGIIQS